MDKRVIEFGRPRWAGLQWGSYAVAVLAAAWMLWLNYTGALNAPAVLSMAFCIFCGCALGFATWYARRTFSHGEISRMARRTMAMENQEFADKVLDLHPLADDIRQEIRRQSILE